MSMKKISLIILLISLSSITLANGEFPEIKNFWLQAAPPNVAVMAAYGELVNNTNQDIILVDAYSPAFGATMIHQTKVVDGVAKMIHQAELVIKPSEKLIFKPGGFHIMLMQPKFLVNVNDGIKINLLYKSGDTKIIQELWFPVEKR